MAETIFKISIDCMTFNQSKYITKTMDGFCMQETNFPFVCTIIDDCSVDGEQNVINDYLNIHFDIQDISKKETEYGIITLAQHKTNRNCYFAVLLLKYNHYKIWNKKYEYIKEWRDKVPYIAFCEGDDYWTNPQKLQKQVNYMESHPECGLCYTDCNVYYEKENLWDYSIFESKQVRINGTNPLLSNGVGYTANMTWLFRNSVLKQIPQNPGFIDGAFYWLCYFSLLSEIGYIPECTGVYRRNEGSLSCHNDKLKTFRYNKDTFFLFDYFFSKFPDSEKNRLEYYDSRLHFLYAEALECGDQELINAYKKLYPSWFLRIANAEIRRRGNEKKTPFSLTYKLARKILFIFRNLKALFN